MSDFRDLLETFENQFPDRDYQIEIVAPYRDRHKRDLIAASAALPLHLTLTCMAPRDGQHCGACNKCRERQEAFRDAGVEDKTKYVS